MVRLQLQSVSKRFPGVHALNDVSISINAAEVHALCGENGAGKSTLMNILTGNIQPDSGTITLHQKQVLFRNPKQAFAYGISIVYQHLSLIETLSVAENIFANQQPVNRLGIIQFDVLYKKTAILLKELGIGILPTTLVSKLSPPQRQMVEIAKALSKNPQVLILDEPTASLTDPEIKILFTLIVKLKAQGVTIVYISHRLPEIFELADRISILKDGKFQGTFQKAELSKEQLIKKMVGRDIIEVKPVTYEQQRIVLEVKRMSSKKLTNINFVLHQGEILGLAGLAGAGRTEIARAIFGADKITAGEILLDNTVLTINHPADAISNRLVYVPEDRQGQGLFSEMTIQDNIIAATLKCATSKNFYSKNKALKLSNEFIKKLTISSSSSLQRVGTLSGGNQQKVLLAKWLGAEPKVLMIDEPTHGIDIGSKQEIYHILKDLSKQGTAIILISSELPELLAHCNRIIVIRNGTLVGELNATEATEEKIIALATG